MLTFAYLIYRKRLISYSTCQTAYPEPLPRADMLLRVEIWKKGQAFPWIIYLSIGYVVNFWRVDYIFRLFSQIRNSIVFINRARISRSILYTAWCKRKISSVKLRPFFLFLPEESVESLDLKIDKLSNQSSLNHFHFQFCRTFHFSVFRSIRISNKLHPPPIRVTITNPNLQNFAARRSNHCFETISKVISIRAWRNAGRYSRGWKQQFAFNSGDSRNGRRR